MRTYIAQLQKSSGTPFAAQSAPTKFTPLETQIQQLMASLPENRRQGDWNMADLIARLSGKYRDKPHAMKVAEALRRLGWTRHRDYSRAGGGTRVWRHPGSAAAKA